MSGEVSVGGAKNSVLKLMAAALLAEGTTVLTNAPDIADVPLMAEVLRGQAERFDAFARLPHYPFPGGRSLRIPFTAMGAAYYSLRDRLGV